MDTAPSRALPYNPVTSLHLRSYEKLDKRQFVKIYVQDQKFYAGSYSADGKAYFSTWGDQKYSAIEEPKAAEPSTQRNAFGTPVLKARVAKPVKDNSSMSESPLDSEGEKLEVRQNVSRKNTYDPPKKGIARKVPNKENKEVSRPPSCSTSKKRSFSTPEDEEHAVREYSHHRDQCQFPHLSRPR